MALPPRARMLRLWLPLLLVSMLVAVACTKLNTSGSFTMGVGSTHVMVDYPEPSIVARRALTQDITTLEKRAELYSRMLTTAPVLERVAARMRIPADQLSGVARTTASVPIPLTQPDSEERAAQIVDTRAPYRLELQADPDEPILAIYTAAPTAEEAQRLADEAIAGLEDYLVALAKEQRFDERNLPQLRQLGTAQATAVSGKAKIIVAAFTFVTAFVLTAVALWLLLRPVPSPERAPRRPRPRAFDDWPHTNRLMPWTLAGFLCMLWLTPFDKIELSIPTPIDMKLDRLVLPLLVLVFLLALSAGPRARPRWNPTLIHVAVGLLVAVSFVSVVINARDLNQSLELMLSLKKLPLLLSYVVVFLIVSTAIRPTEVRAFMILTLGLAVIVGLGIIFELRFTTNIFSTVIAKILPGPFVLTGEAIAGGGVDSLGRRGIVGPTAVGLEAVTVLALALPIGIVGLLSATERRHKVLFAIAACVLVAGMLGTGRKSGLVAPVAVVLTLAYFRRRELLKLAPVGLVMGIAVTVLSPGAIHGVVAQFSSADSSSVATTSDRIADYDGVRPDVWAHLLLGRGFGSYNITTYRMLDSEILSRTLETGVIGLLAFLFMGASVVLASRKVIARRESPYAPLALVGAASAVCFLVVATLFDVMGFPHATYIFLSIAGLAAVVVKAEEEPAPAPPPERVAAEPPARPRLVDASPVTRDALV